MYAVYYERLTAGGNVDGGPIVTFDSQDDAEAFADRIREENSKNEFYVAKYTKLPHNISYKDWATEEL